MSWRAGYGIDAPQRGRMAVELRPPVPVERERRCASLTRDARVAVFAGDDVGDLPAFAASSISRTGKLEHVVRIGVASAEAAPEILAADIVVDGPSALADLVEGLAA